jgi:GT2 family glycosyltransferase
VTCENRGYSHANNRGAMLADARYVLFLNPDTELLEGTLADLIALMDDRPQIGIAGCRQLATDGVIFPTSRRFASPARTLAEAFGSERLAPQAGQRILDPAAYDREFSSDWVIGSFMLVRREALLSGGLLDERYFLYSEEEDFCRRIRSAGWDVRHLPQMTIVHHVGKAGKVPRLEAQRTLARLQYADKHFTPRQRLVHRIALLSGHGLRLAVAGVRNDPETGAVARAGLRMALGRDEPPFIPPPTTALPAESLAAARKHARDATSHFRPQR